MPGALRESSWRRSQFANLTVVMNTRDLLAAYRYSSTAACDILDLALYTGNNRGGHTPGEQTMENTLLSLRFSVVAISLVLVSIPIAPAAERYDPFTRELIWPDMQYSADPLGQDEPHRSELYLPNGG